jgi:hypothetical protein
MAGGRGGKLRDMAPAHAIAGWTDCLQPAAAPCIATAALLVVGVPSHSK